MDKKQQVILEYRKGKSLRLISKILKINRQTATKYIRDYENSIRELLDLEKDKDIKKLELIDEIVKKPKYTSKNRNKIKVTDELIKRIKFYLNENEIKIANGMKKQQKKKIDIHAALKEEGFDISYTTVSNAINAILNKKAEAFIKQDYELGDVCEFDWGEVKIYIDGVLKTFQMAVFTSAKGNYRYALLFPNQDTACFLEAHSMFFENIQGAYKTMVYDNMRVAVAKFVGPTEKEPTEALLKLSIYYGFEFRFCNVRSGNEKGHVEKSVDYIRTKSFCNKDSFSSLSEANIHLLECCRKLNQEPKKYNDNKTAIDVLKEEQAFLLPNKPKMDCAKIKELRVDKYSTITINNSHYSVPEQYVNRLIFTKVYSEKILCYCDNKLIAQHSRAINAYEWIINLEHYTSTLKRKPGAFKNSIAFKQAPQEIKLIYNIYYIKKEKEFIELIQFMNDKNKSIEEIQNAIEIIQKITPTDISTEKIISICLRKGKDNNISYMPNKFEKSSETLEKSREILRKISNLMPVCTENFHKEGNVI